MTQPIGQLSPFSASTAYMDTTAFQRRFSSGQEAVFVQAEGSLGARWSVMGGLRAEAFAIDGGHALEPRVSMLYRFGQRQSLHASWNASAQLSPTMDLLSYTANRRLRPITVHQTAVGMLVWQNGWGSLEAEAYARQYQHEPVSTEFPQLMLFNSIDSLGDPISWLPLESAGSARAHGVEAVLRLHWRDRAHLLLSASHTRTTYRALDGVRRIGNYDLPVEINAMSGFRLPWGIALNSREAFSSGRVYTPFDLTNSLAQNRSIYDLSQMNAARGPLYNRLDLELERKFHIAKGLLDVRGGAENVLNRGNLLGYAWLENCQTGSGCQQSVGVPKTKVDQMGRYPVFSMEYKF